MLKLRCLILNNNQRELKSLFKTNDTALLRHHKDDENLWQIIYQILGAYLVVDTPMEYAQLALDNEIQTLVDAKNSLEVW